MLAYLPKRVTNPALIFRTFGRKTQLFGKHLRTFLKFSYENSEKCIILAYFEQKLKNPRVNFSRVWTKKQTVEKF